MTESTAAAWAEPVQLDDRDLEIVDALQVNPRATWATVAEVLAVSPLTVARRWGKLQEMGLAWVEAGPGPALFRGVFLMVRCRRGDIGRTAQALSSMPDVVTVGRLLGLHDLYAIAVAPSPAAVRGLMTERIDRLGAEEVQASVYTRVLGGPSWRIAVLDRQQAEALRHPRVRALRPLEITAEDRALFAALNQDGRRSWAELAGELSSTPAAVRRRTEHLRRRGTLAFRVDLARPSAGWPYAALVRVRVDERTVGEVARDLGTWSASRFVAQAIGPANLLWVVSLHDSDALHPLLADLRRRHADLEVLEAALIPEISKLHGRVLDDRGRAVSQVPVDPWHAERSEWAPGSGG